MGGSVTPTEKLRAERAKDLVRAIREMKGVDSEAVVAIANELEIPKKLGVDEKDLLI